MLLAGDEIGHSQQGNNNSYCQDNEITWLDWENMNQIRLDHVRSLIRLRKKSLCFPSKIVGGTRIQYNG